MSNSIEDKYINGDYIEHNPTWDIEHAPRKAKELIDVIPSDVLKSMFDNRKYVIEIGCGAGGVIYNFSKLLIDQGVDNIPVGYDISPVAIEMANEKYGKDVKFSCAKKIDIKQDVAVVLLVDVLEHVEEPGAFMCSNKELSDYFLIRLPLDKSLWNIVLNKLPKLQRELGHLHYFTYSSAISFVRKEGMDILSYHLTNNFNVGDNRKTVVSKLMWPIRLITSNISARLNSLIWGGNSIVLLAKIKDD